MKSSQNLLELQTCKCGGINKVAVVHDMFTGEVIEYSTHCTKCGYDEYWIAEHFKIKKINKLIEQIKSLKGVKTVEQVGDDRIVVEFEQWIEPCDLVKGEVYVDYCTDNEFVYARVFRFKKLRKNGKLKLFSQLILSDDYIGKGWGKTKTYCYKSLRHATPEEKRKLLKFEERNGI